MDVLAQFVKSNKLKVNVNKTKVMCLGRQAVSGTVEYEGVQLERVAKFCYLGLEFDIRADDEVMMKGVLSKAQKAWSKLNRILEKQGWYRGGTKLLLIDTFVRSHLIYGAPVWGIRSGERIGGRLTGLLERLGAFYRSLLRVVLGIERKTRNEILAIVSTRPPLQVFIAKQVIRYFATLSSGLEQERRLAAQVMGELDRMGATDGVFTAVRGRRLAERWPTVRAIYQEYGHQVRERLAGTARHLHPQLVSMWGELADLGLGGKRTTLELPVPWTTFRRLFPKCRFVLGEGADQQETQLRMWAWPQWLVEGGRAPSQLVQTFYEDAGWWTEATGVELMHLEGSGWTERDRVLASFIAANGMGKAVWVASSYIIEIVQIL